MAITIKDISKKTGFTVATISYVLSGKGNQNKISEKTQQKVLRVAEEMGYRANLVAKNLRCQKTNTIGIVFNDLSYSWASDVMEGINKVLFPRGYQPLLGITLFDRALEQKVIRSFLDSRVEGLIIQPSICDKDFYKDLLCKSNIPIAFLGDSIEMSSVKSFMLDAKAAGRQQVDSLHKLGYTKIAVISVTNKTHQSSLRRVGAIERINELELYFPEKFDLSTAHMADKEIIDNIRSLLSSENPPQAFAVSNDSIAFHVMGILKDLGKSDIAVIGIGDYEESSNPLISLSTICEPRKQMGEDCAKYLINSLENKDKDKSQEILYPPKTIFRKSTTVMDK